MVPVACVCGSGCWRTVARIHVTGQGRRAFTVGDGGRACWPPTRAGSGRRRRGSVKLIDEGVRRSRTFAQLVNEVHTTDVIVYVEASFGLPPEVSGRILLARRRR